MSMESAAAPETCSTPEYFLCSGGQQLTLGPSLAFGEFGMTEHLH